MNKHSAVFLAAIILGTLGVPTGAQSYPDKPICVVVPYASGMQTDAVACQTTVKLPELLGQQIVIDPPGTGVKNFIQIPFSPDGVNHGYIKIRIMIRNDNIIYHRQKSIRLTTDGYMVLRG